jgi:hypothetical protein
MNASSWWHTIYRLGRWRTPSAAARWAGVGGILGLITITLSAVNVVSAQQAIALALPAAIITIAGSIRSAMPDSCAAWRAGFRQGCRVAQTCRRDALYPGGAVAPNRSAPVSQRGLPPAAL